jgi:hypothetical protein
MKEYLNIKRKPIFVTMKTLLFFVPVGIITNNIYVHLYGHYTCHFDKYSFLNGHYIIAFLIFSIISGIAYLVEKYIIPEFILFSKKIETSEKSNNWTDKYLKNKFGFNVYDKVKELYPNQPLKYELIRELMFWPIVFILWLICMNNILAYVLIIPFIYIIYQFGRILIGVFDNYNIT